MRPLIDLLGDMPVMTNLEGSGAMEIAHITTDSRAVMPGSMFVAIRGGTVDGHAHVADALARGAVAIMVHIGADTKVPVNVALVSVEDTREALAHLAAAFYGAQPQHIVAVTGTDGKTSTAEFARQLSTLMGHRSASIGTLGMKSDDAVLDARLATTHTSPDAIMLHHTLAELAAAGVTHVAMEASSHGIHQYRVEAVTVEAAAVTVITRDHLDYHGTVEAYVAAKLRLFTRVLPKGARAVLNADDAYYDMYRAACEARGHEVLSYGKAGDDIRILDVAAVATGLDARVRAGGEEVALNLPFYGEFQLMNMCAAVGLVAPRDALAATMKRCEQLQGVPGRMELVATHPNGAAVFVDYAHTPAALEKLLRVARAHVRGKLCVVFGCGGDRDAGKRPLMGAVAQDLADHVIITDDNPRSEDPATIRAVILEACPKAIDIGDRKQAIHAALQQLKKDDVLIVAGKGHETTQTIGQQTYEFNDAKKIRDWMAAL